MSRREPGRPSSGVTVSGELNWRSLPALANASLPKGISEAQNAASYASSNHPLSARCRK